MSLFVFFISLLIVAQHVSGNRVSIIRSWRLRDVIASCWYVPWLQGGCQVRLTRSASMDSLPTTYSNLGQFNFFRCRPAPKIPPVNGDRFLLDELLWMWHNVQDLDYVKQNRNLLVFVPKTFSRMVTAKRRIKYSASVWNVMCVCVWNKYKKIKQKSDKWF